MIKINLLKNSLKSVKAKTIPMTGPAGEEILDPKKIQTLGLGKLILLVLPVAGLYLYSSQVVIPELEQKVRQEEQKLSEVKQKNEENRKKIETVDSLKKQKAQFEIKNTSLEKFKLNRLKPVKIFDAIQKSIPEKVWLSRLDIKEENLSISGTAITDADLTVFMDALAKTHFMKEVNLVRSGEITAPRGGLFRSFQVAIVIDLQKLGGVSDQ